MSGTLQPNRLAPLTQTVFDNSQAGANAIRKPAFLIAQTLNALALGVYPAFSVSQVQALCGRGSMIDRLFQSYFALDNQGPIFIVPLADATGAAPAAGFFVLAGTALSTGTVPYYIAGQSVPVGVSVGDTGVIMAASTVAAINGNPDLPVTATAVAASDATLRKVQLTSRHAGLCGNQIDLRIAYRGIRNGEQMPAGTSVAVGAMTGGTLNPSLASAYAQVGDARGYFFVDPYVDAANIQAAQAALAFASGRWSATRKTRGHRFSAFSGPIATGGGAILSFLNTTANDDPHSSYFCYENAAPTPEWEAAGMWAGAMAISLRAQPNLPVQTIKLPNFLPPQQAPDNLGGPFQATTRELILENGGGVARYDRGTPEIVRAVTNYTTNALGSPDQSYQDTEDMFLLMEIADREEAMESQSLARTLLAQDGTKVAPGIPTLTPRGALGKMIALYRQMELDGLVDDATDFIAAATATANSQTAGELDLLWPDYLVVGLRQLTNTIQFRKLAGAAAAVTGS